MKTENKTAEDFLTNSGYGSGTNYTTDAVANLMEEYAKEFHKWIPIEKTPEYLANGESDTLLLKAANGFLEIGYYDFQTNRFVISKNIKPTHWRKINIV